MYAILIHFIGYVLLDAYIPPWVYEVESGFACIWYICCALIDVIALATTSSPWIKCILAISCAWSATLAFEVVLLQDLLQSHDWVAQYLIDGLLIACAIGLVVVRIASRHKEVSHG